MPKRVTMKDVAARAGVSPTTVCRALNLDPRIPEPTRKQVKNAARALGYRPDPLLSALSRQRRGKTSGSEITTLAYLTHFETADEWMKHSFYLPLFKGAQTQARANGYKLEHFWMREPGMTGERLGRILFNRGIGGICIAPTPAVDSRLTFDWKRFSCVTMGYSLRHPDLHRTTTHHFHTVLVAARRLWSLGYTRIGLCLYDRTSQRVDDQWLAAALLIRQQFPQKPMESFLFDDTTLGRVAAWVADHRIDVVLSDNQQVLHELRRHGVRVPGSVDYATLHWTRTEPEIAGIDQRPAAIGSAAIDLLIAQIRRGERGVPAIPVTSMVDGVWVNGPSVRKKSKPA